MRHILMCITAACTLALVGRRLAGQSVVDRAPSLPGAWLVAPGVVQFNFVHRFQESGPPEHRISNSPTFMTAIGLPHIRAAVGAAYATNSEVVPRMPNEWEFFVRSVPLGPANGLVDLWAQLGYNQGARSVDAELGASRRLGPVRVLVSGRTFSNAFGVGERRYAAAGGLVLRLRPNVALAGDVAALNERMPDERPVWSVGLQLAIPSTPHSVSLQATNASTGTLEGTSRGGAEVRFGFEYTVPITLARYRGRRAPRTPQSTGGTVTATGAATVSARIQDFAFAPSTIEIPAGTTVTWINDGAVPHTVALDEGATFESGVLAPNGGTWSIRFVRPGTYAFHCGPHPFMRGVVVVQ